MKHSSLFSGIGGFDLAAEWMGWENVMQCEIDPFCQRILRHHFPSAHLYGDIREIDGTAWRGKIDILTGGFPCQPFSAAGQRRGTEDDRFLWPEMLRVIGESQPTWIVAENVRGLATLDGGVVFERVCSELEENGYEVQPFCIPACAVSAPHKRERIWFVAHNDNAGKQRTSGTDQGKSRTRKSKGIELRTKLDDEGGDDHSNAPDASGQRLEGWEREIIQRGSNGPSSNDRAAPDSRCERRIEGASERMESASKEPEQKDARNGHWSRESWLQAATRLCRVDDGIPRELDGITVPRWRKESLKAYGNAIAPQVAYQIFQAIAFAQYE